MREFSDRVALVTGGAAGIGRALCEQLATAGAFVMVTDIDKAGAEQVAEEIRQRGGRAAAKALDVSSETEMEQVVTDVASTHRRLDYMFNNAAAAVVGELRDGNVADFRRVVDVNLFGVVHGTMSAYRVMLRQGFGHIVNISSITGLMPTPILTAYSASKWAIIGFSTAVRAEAAGLGVKVSVACPGLVRTDIGERSLYWNVRKEDHLAQLPLRWAATPAQVARAILRGTVGNQEIIVCPFVARLAWWIHRACPWIFVPLMSGMLKRYRAIRIKP